MKRGSCKWRVCARSLETEGWRPGPRAGRNLGGAAAGRWGPHKRSLGELVTVSGRLDPNTLTVKPPAPNLPSRACPSLPQGQGGKPPPHLNLGNARTRNRPFQVQFPLSEWEATLAKPGRSVNVPRPNTAPDSGPSVATYLETLKRRSRAGLRAGSIRHHPPTGSSPS